LNDYCNQSATVISSAEHCEIVVDAVSTTSALSHSIATPINDLTIDLDSEHRIAKAADVATPNFTPTINVVSAVSQDLVVHSNLTASAFPINEESVELDGEHRIEEQEASTIEVDGEHNIDGPAAMNTEVESDPGITATTPTGAMTTQLLTPDNDFVSSEIQGLVVRTNSTALAVSFVSAILKNDQEVEMSIENKMENFTECETGTLTRPPLWNFRSSISQESAVTVSIDGNVSKMADCSVNTGRADLNLQLSDKDATSDVITKVNIGVAAETVKDTDVEQSILPDEAIVETSVTVLPTEMLASESGMQLNNPSKSQSLVSFASDVSIVTERELHLMIPSKEGNASLPRDRKLSALQSLSK